MKAYPEYKDSGVPWLEKVPKHWEIKRLGSKFIERREKVSDKDYPPLSVTKNGILPQLANAAKTNDGDNRKRVCAGDFVINSRSDRKGSSGLSNLDGSVSLINTVLQPRDIYSRYVHCLFKSYPFQEEFYRVGRGIVADLWSTQYSEMSTIMIPIPVQEEQHYIARFLDYKTWQINKLIRAKKRMIELLKEQKQCVINDAVTGKIDVRTGKPYPKYKDSGVEWLGQVPEGWEVVRCGFLFREKTEIGYPDLELLSITIDKGIIKQSETGRRTRASENRAMYKRISIGDLGYNLMNAFMGGIAFSKYNGIISPAYAVAKPLKPMNVDYYHFLFRTNACGKEIDRLSYGIMYERNRLYFERFKLIQVTFPSLKEQHSITNYINEKCLSVDNAISRIEREISLMQEYRTRLIADVVTGKLDVRGIEVPDVPEEEADAPEVNGETEGMETETDELGEAGNE